MAERKQLSKKARFEVFKRDSFMCQYCGQSAPDVVLEVDHIVPVAEGGDNDIMNLITSCRDCNRGKGKKTLSDRSTISKQKERLDELNKRKQQLAMMLEWKKSLMDIEEEELDTLSSLFAVECGASLNDNGLRILRDVLRKFGFEEVYEAIKIAGSKYFPSEVLKRLGGICYNRKIGRKAEYYGNKETR